MHLNVPFVLASASPRRRELLRSIGLSFSIEISGIDETDICGRETPNEVVECLALAKANDIAKRFPDALVLGADTIVALDEEILGKPNDPAEAALMLGKLSGRSNTVFSAVALVHRVSGRCFVGHERTRVTFSDLTEQEIDSYVASGAPMDKAGAYGIQGDLGALFISGVEGDYFNVVGLPLHRMYQMMRRHFSDFIDFSANRNQ